MTDWDDSAAIGQAIHAFARRLWPLPRSARWQKTEKGLASA